MLKHHNQPVINHQINRKLGGSFSGLVLMQVDPNFAESLLLQEAIKHMSASPFYKVIQTIPVPEILTIPNFKIYLGTKI